MANNPEENERCKQVAISSALSLLGRFLADKQVITPPQRNAARRAAKLLKEGGWTSSVDSHLHKLTRKDPDWYTPSDNQVELSVSQARLRYADEFTGVYRRLRLAHNIPTA